LEPKASVIFINVNPSSSVGERLAAASGAIVDAIEVLPAGSAAQRCPQELICSLQGDGTVSGSWTAAVNVVLSG
jgi:hypothetical protein